MRGRVVLVTGATDGLGRAVATELAARGAALLLHGRSEARLADAAREVAERAGTAPRATYLADFEDLAQVRALARRVLAEQPRLDVLVNNAALGIDPVRRVSRDGLESTFQVDYLAPYVLCHALEPLLVASAPSRIVNVGSAGQAPLRFDDLQLERDYDGMQAYCQAKLALVMLTIDRAADLARAGVGVDCVHPASMMPTKIVTHMFTPMSELADGVRSVVGLVAEPAGGPSGRYLDTTREARALGQAYDPAARARLRAEAARLTGVP